MKHNETQIAFRGGLVHEKGVDHTNDVGLWTGVAGTLQLLAREGDPAPDVEGDVWFLGGGFASLGDSGEAAFARALAGEGITEDNDIGIWAGITGDIDLIAREGNPVPGLGDSIQYDQMSQQIVSAEGRIAIRVRFRGPVTPSNDHALMCGELGSLHVRLREGDSVLGQVPGTVYDDLLFSKIAMNDRSDLISYAGIAGSDVSPTNDVVLMFGDHRTGLWYPFVRSGDIVGGRTTLIPDPVAASELIRWDTGGSDGEPQSLNDSRQVAAKLTFTDATHGAYLIELPDFADSDANGTVDLLDYEAFVSCVTGPGSGELRPECVTFDVDWDDDIDFIDFWAFQLLFGGSE